MLPSVEGRSALLANGVTTGAASEWKGSNAVKRACGYRNLCLLLSSPFREAESGVPPKL